MRCDIDISRKIRFRNFVYIPKAKLIIPFLIIKWTQGKYAVFLYCKEVILVQVEDT
jgi:hypothetical protein